MNWLQGIPLAWEGIMANKLRSFLTMLGIIIGVGAVIGLVAVAQGATSNVTSQLESLGSNLIIISPFRSGTLKAEDAVELEERVPTITAAAPVVGFNLSAVQAGGLSYEPSVSGQGVTPAFATARNFRVEAGRFFTDQDVEARAQVAVIGRKVAAALFPRGNPLGAEIRVDGRPLVVVGVLEAKGAFMGQDHDDSVLVPLTVAQRISQSTAVNTIYVQGRSSDVALLTVNHITSIFQLKARGTDGQLPVRISSQDEMLSTVNNMTRTLSLMLAAIAGISLLVGGIGIMNIMLVSVTERTREIGIRKAIGARNRQILAQFVVESMVISLTGGFLGIVLGIGGSLLLGRLLGFASVITLPAVLGSFAFAALIGLFFGVYPAVKAASLDPVEALRYQ